MLQIDMGQGIDEQGRKFGYIHGEEGGYFFTWMPTLAETLASLEEDEVDGDGGLVESVAAEELRKRILGRWADESEIV